MKIILISTVIFVAALQGCSKSEGDIKTVSLDDAASQVQAKQAIEEQKADAAPKADKSIPLDQYQELNSGKQLLFANLAVNSMPLDYEKIAAQISNEFSSQLDEFKKRDMLTALKPGIDKEVAKAKVGRYYFIEMNEGLEKYDFSSKSFPVTALTESTSYRFFYDLSQYRLTFSNSLAFNQLPVPDENEARTVESLRTNGSLQTRVYFFAADSKLGEPIVIGEITKVKITDRKGNSVAEM
jgi:hypothetical protein